MFDKVLIANRGEIAVRVARTCRELGVRSVAVHSDVDAGARHTAMADETIHLPGVSPVDTYLDGARIIEGALSAGADAIHPGYGFLSENAGFADAVLAAGLAWVGPPPEALRALGDKISARRLAASAEVPVVPGLADPVEELEVVYELGRSLGYPLAVKASGGGGGRGLKIARSESEVADAFESARREAEAYFGSRDVFVERYLEAPKHLEVQLLAPADARPMWLGVRDCSMQRRHQKLVEETPPPLFADRAPAMGEAVVRLAEASGYVNAGTAEFLVDAGGDFFFLEVNARLQVEHTVTEEVLGLDLVACQLRIAAGEPVGFTQEDLVARGHAIECRINAEDPATFIPSPGVLTRYTQPSGLGVRIDSGYAAGDEIPAAYDSLLAKVIAWGSDREAALARMDRALSEFHIEGVSTTIPLHRAILADETFRAGRHTTATLESDPDRFAVASTGEIAPEDGADVLLIHGRSVRLWNRAMAPFAPAAVHGRHTDGDLLAPMQGTILEVLVTEGQSVIAGQPLLVLEAMKMETTIEAPLEGVVAELRAAAGASVASGELLAVVR